MKRKKKESIESIVHVCPSCGKVFEVLDHGMWAYKFSDPKKNGCKTTYYCSWHCLRTFQVPYLEKKNKKFMDRYKNSAMMKRLNEELEAAE